MVSLARTIRNIRRVGFKEWSRMMLYIGDAKSGRHVGTDECVLVLAQAFLRPGTFALYRRLLLACGFSYECIADSFLEFMTDLVTVTSRT
jgi:hypothetical protein